MAEKEYIEREGLLNEVEEIRPMNWTDTEAEITEQADFDWFENLVKSQPTADVQEVRHGKWETPTKPFPYYHWKCSICGCEEYSQVDRNGKYREMNYCPHCGAKMDKEQE